MNTLTENLTKSPQFLTIPLTEEAHQKAQKFASTQSNIKDKKRIYLNTLAVYAVNRYLNWIQIETDLEGSNSWNIITNNLFNINDLDLPNIGQLICIPVLPDQDTCETPELLSPDAIAYIPVRFKEVLNEVEILGYRLILNANEPSENIYLDLIDTQENYDDGLSLFPIENLLDWLFYVEDVKALIEDETIPLYIAIRQILEVQNRSLAQFAVECINKVQSEDESHFSIIGKEVLKNNTLVLSNHNLSLRSKSSADTTVNDEEIEAELEKLGGEFLQKVKAIITNSSDSYLPEPINLEIKPESLLIRLGNWLKQEIETLKEIAKTGYLTLEEMAQSSIPELRSFSLQPAMRYDGIKRGKLIDIGAYLGDCQVILLVVIKPISEEKNSILVQVRPAGEQKYLPPDLKLILLDESGINCKVAVARNQDNFIQIQFNASNNDQFSIQLMLEDHSITEKFMI
jgi:hypothetical protein